MFVIIGQRSKIQIEAIGVTRIDKPCGGANIKTKKIKTMIISKLASTMQKNACAEVVSVGNAQLLYYFIFRQENSVLSFSFQARVNFQVTSFPLVSYYSAILCLVPFPLKNHPSLSIFCELFGDSEIVLLPWDRFRDEKNKKEKMKRRVLPLYFHLWISYPFWLFSSLCMQPSFGKIHGYLSSLCLAHIVFRRILFHVLLFLAFSSVQRSHIPS